MLKSQDVVVICCFFLGVGPLHGKILPPQNVTLSWLSDFDPQLTWSPPPHTVENCEYEVTTKSCVSCKPTGNTSWNGFTVMDGGSLELSVKTKCGNNESENVTIRTAYPDLVKSFECYVESSKRTYCNWLTATNTPDLSFYYSLMAIGSSISDRPPPLRECPSYRYTGVVKTGCDLQTEVYQIMYILFHGTLDDKPVRNTFQKDLTKLVKPLALEWNVTKGKDIFNINWKSPDILKKTAWDFIINYTECGKQKEAIVKAKESHELKFVPHCDYRISIRAKYYEGGMSPWSEVKYFKAETDPSAMVYAAIIIPLVFAGLAVFAFVCCRKNKDKLFPDVPVPEDLLSGISDNNNKSTFHNLVVPAEKEELCTVTLVTDLESDKTLS